MFSVISIVHQNPNLIIGKAKNTLNCPREILAVTDGAAVATCTIVETSVTYVGIFSSNLVEYAPVSDITCKINICKKN